MKTIFTIILGLLMLNSFCQFSFDSCLIAYYPFNGNANDESGNSHNGTVNGASLTADKHGNVNSAYSFDGNNDYISISNHSDIINIDSITICGWAYPTALNAHNTIVSKVNPNRDFSLKLFSNGHFTPEFAHGSSYYSCVTDTFVQTYAWAHLLGTWDGIYWKTYLNGELVKTCNHSGNVPLWTGSRMDIGSMNGTEFFIGTLDDIRVYNCALSESEVLELYNVTNTSVNIISNDVSIQLFPNPATDHIIIQSDRNNISRFEVYNILGNKIIENDLFDSQINIYNLEKGLYFIRLYDKNNLLSIKKIIKL